MGSEHAIPEDYAECSKCHETMLFDYGSEPTELCHNCAHEEVDILRERIAALEALVATLSKPVSDEESDKMLVFVNGHTTMTKTHSVLERKRMTEAASWLVLSRMAAARLKAEVSECGYCGGTGEICYSSTSYGPCPECIAARLKEQP